MRGVGIVTFPGFDFMTFAAMSIFEVANSEFGERRYDIHFLSENGGALRTSAGLVVETEAGYSAASMQAMRIDDDCHLIDSVEVGLSVRNELMRQRH